MVDGNVGDGEDRSGAGSYPSLPLLCRWPSPPVPLPVLCFHNTFLSASVHGGPTMTQNKD